MDDIDMNKEGERKIVDGIGASLIGLMKLATNS